MSQCTNPPELEESALLVFIDNDAEPEVAAHLGSCPHCHGRMVRLRDLQNELRGRLRRIDCPPAMTLSEYRRGLLNGDRRIPIAAHVSDCPSCREELALLDQFLVATGNPQPEKPGVLERVQVVIAELLAGAGPGGRATAPIGVRGGESEVLIFEAGAVQITLRRVAEGRGGKGFSLLGLVSGEDMTGWEVHLWRKGKRIGTREVDRLGSFDFGGIPPGRYELILEGSRNEIHIQAVEIRG